MEKEIKQNKMATMPVGKMLFSISVPIVISMLVQALYNIVDSIFVSQINDMAFTAVSLAFPYQNLQISFGVGTGVGVNAFLSRSLGEGNRKNANFAAGNAFFLVFLTYVMFALVGAIFARPIIAAQTSVEQIIDYGESHIRVISLGSIFCLMQIMAERLLQSTGRSVLSMITQGVGAIINIILDPILIFGYFGLPEMGIVGAAVATVIGQGVAVIIGIILNIKLNKDIEFSFKYIKPVKHIIKSIYRVAVPSILLSSVGSVMCTGMNMILDKFTYVASTAFGSYFRLQSFFFMPVFGLTNGMVPIVSFNFGMGSRERIMKTMKLGLIWAIIIMVVGTSVMWLIPQMLLGMFNPTQELLDIAVPALRFISLSFPIAAFCIVFITMFQSLGTSRYSVVVSVCRQLVVLLPVAFLMSFTGKLELVWLSFPIAELVALPMCVFFLRRTFKHMDAELEMRNKKQDQ